MDIFPFCKTTCVIFPQLLASKEGVDIRRSRGCVACSAVESSFKILKKNTQTVVRQHSVWSERFSFFRSLFHHKLCPDSERKEQSPVR